MSRRQFHAAALLVAASCLVALSAPAFADAYPSKPIRFIVPYPPGGSTDIVTRLLQVPLQKQLGVPIVVENRQGAGGNVGSALVAKSDPDGYTMLLAASGPMAINRSLYKSIPFDVAEDFAPVIQLTAFPLVLEVHPDYPAKTAQEFIRGVTQPGVHQYASGGNGTPQHLMGELFNQATGAKMQHVPYRGGAPALTDLVGGQVRIMFDIIASSSGYIKAGRLRPLAVTSATRVPMLPDVPTLAESGLPGFEFTTWHGIAVAARTPPAIVAKLNGAINAVFDDPEIRRKWEAIGTPVVGGTPEKFAELIRRESLRLGQIVRESGAQLD
jgi:tripartite-type tricarboxylate transporter receptor subunit TctC